MDNSVNCITPLSELSFREFRNSMFLTALKNFCRNSWWFGTKYDIITRILYIVTKSKVNMKMEKNCPVAKIIKVLSMKWNMLVLRQLSENRSKRFNILIEELKPISSRTLSKRLKELEKTALVKRERFDEIPPRVEYSLTLSGLEIIKCFKPLSKWAEKFGDTIWIFSYQDPSILLSPTIANYKNPSNP